MPGTAQQFAIKQHLHVEMANEEGESRIKRYRTQSKDRSMIGRSPLLKLPVHASPVVFLYKTLYSHSVSLHPDVQKGTSKVNDGYNASMD